MVFVGALTIVVGCVLAWYLLQGPDPVRAARPPARAAVPVSVVAAARRDLPIYLNGLGTVQALYTIAIHSQVDGKLIQDAFTEGQHVKKDDVLAKIDPRLYQAALDQAKARRAQDVAQLGAAEKDLTRFKALALKSFETQQNVDLQQAKADQFTASIAADDAAIETAQTQLDYTIIRAPSDGRIGVRQVDPGNLVRASDQGSIATLTRTQPIAVMFTLPAGALDDVRDAMGRGDVEVTAFDQNNRRALSTGKLLLIDNQIDQTTATIRLKAMLENRDQRLWPGRIVNSLLLIPTGTAAIANPSSARQRRPQGLFRWSVNPDNITQTPKSEAGPTAGALTIVRARPPQGDAGR